MICPSARTSERDLRLSAACVLLALNLLSACAAAAQTDVAAGRRLYRHGLLTSGAPVSAVVSGDVSVTGEQLSCASCHQRSGLGTSEGGRQVPPLTADLLNVPRRPPRPDFRPEHADPLLWRPAYEDATLLRAIADGVDSAGRTLDPLMPRYHLPPQDARNLLAYLRSLSSHDSPGVTAQEIHFATVVSASVDPIRRRALLDVLQPFFALKNAETRGEWRRAERAPFFMKPHYAAYRTLRLEVWELDGPMDSWRAQLESRYREQPVMALVSGLVPEGWQIVHDFCAEREIPCLFPNTNIPVTDRTDFYNFYFSAGLALDAVALGRHLTELQTASGNQLRVLQLHRAGSPDSTFAAARLSTALTGVSGLHLVDLDLSVDDLSSAAAAREIGRADVVVVWLQADEIMTSLATPALAAGSAPIYVSSSLAWPGSFPVAESAAPRIRFVHQYGLRLPTDGTRRLRLWADARGIDIVDERLQTNGFFAAELLTEAVQHLRSNFSREYLIERIEHMAERMAPASLYPQLSLAPGQRFATRNAMIVRPALRGELLPVAASMDP